MQGFQTGVCEKFRRPGPGVKISDISSSTHFSVSREGRHPPYLASEVQELPVPQQNSNTVLSLALYTHPHFSASLSASVTSTFPFICYGDLTVYDLAPQTPGGGWEDASIPVEGGRLCVGMSQPAGEKV